MDALDKLDGFASFHGLPRNESKITLIKQPRKMPNQLGLGYDVVIPYRAGDEVSWKLV